MWRAATGLVALFSIVTSACASTPTQVQTAAPETATDAPQATTGPATPQAEEIEATPTVIRQPNPLTTTVIDVADRRPPPVGGVPAPTRGYTGGTERLCSGEGDDRLEMAFRATVRTVDRSSVAPWVTFDVTAWYTREVQSEMALWAPDFPGRPGEDWLITSSRYDLFFRTTGEVYWCESVPATEANLVEWAEYYGGSVPLNSRIPENPPSAAVLELIDEGEARWRAAGLDGYSAIVTLSDLDTSDGMGCGTTKTRITIEDGDVAQAYEFVTRCEAAGPVLTIDDLFQFSREFAGLAGDIEDGRIRINDDYGFIEHFGGVDRSLEIFLDVTEFIPGPQAVVVGTDRDVAFADARARWQRARLTDYTVTFEIGCRSCLEPAHYTVVVRDGEPVDADIEQFGASPPLTVNDLFELLEYQLVPGRGSVVAAYHELGYPTEVRFGKIPQSQDDDRDYFIRDLTVD